MSLPSPPPVTDDLPVGWEAATTYHQLKAHLTEQRRRVVEDRAIDDIIRRAQHLLRHARRPRVLHTRHWPAVGELDLDTTLAQPRPWGPQDLIVQQYAPREADVVAILDMSLSMTGEKLALTAVAVALMYIKLEHISVISFDSTAHVLVDLRERPPVREVVRRILRVPAQGFTNIEAGLTAGREILRTSRKMDRVAVVMTDGVANMGARPSSIASTLPRLHVVQVGPTEPQGTRTCTAMARSGRGRRYRAVLYQQLPTIVRTLVRECFGA